MKKLKALLFLSIVALFLSCASTTSNISMQYIPENRPSSYAFVSPSSLSDALAVEFMNTGYEVIFPDQFENLLGRFGVDEIEIQKPENIYILRDQGIDALLYVRSQTNWDGSLESATIRIIDPYTNKIIMIVAWKNGWGGVTGSIADSVMKLDINRAAKSIFDEINTMFEEKYNSTD